VVETEAAVTGEAGRPGGRHDGASRRGDGALLLTLIFVLAVLASASPIRNFDYWWHLATGSWILEHRTVPREDAFSFTAAGQAWVDHEWLFQVLAIAGHRSLGPEGLVVVKVLLVLALCLLLYRRLQGEGHGPSGAAVLLAPALIGASFRLDVRPELATLVLMPALLGLIMEARRRDRLRSLLLVPPVAAVWANLHPGVVLFPALLAIGTGAAAASLLLPDGGERPAAQRAERKRFAGRLALLTGGTALAVLFNPSGPGLYAVPFRLSALLASLPWPNLEWARPQPADFPLFWMALPVAGLIAVAGIRRADPVATPAMLLVGLLATIHLRNIGLFFLLLPLGIAGPARAIVETVQRIGPLPKASAGGRIRPGFIAAGVVVLSAIPVFLFLPPRPSLGLGIDPSNQAAGAVEFLEREGVGRRMYNDVRFGGYLIWRRHPEHRVFIDGRNELYPDLMHDIADGMQDAPRWNALLERHGIDSAFLRYPPTLQKVQYPAADGQQPREDLRAFSAAYFPAAAWALVYWDDEAMIFLRRGPEHENVIARLEYRAVHPDDWQHLFAGVLLRRVPLAPILGEIERKLADDPDCLRARRLYERFAALEEREEDPAGIGGGGGRR
jgi:hypothetical protein